MPDDAAVLTVPNAELLLGPLAAELWGHPARRLTVFGITGTAGKTSVAHTLLALFQEKGHSVASLTTDGMQIGEDFTPAGNVTPDAVEIQRFLRDCADAGVSFVILELSAYMLEHTAAAGVPLSAVLLTNLKKAHVGNGEFRTDAQYRAAKLSLLACGAPLAVVPASLAGESSAAKVITFGENGDFCANDVQPYADAKGFGSKLTLGFPTGEKLAISLPIPGDFAVENALAAAALAQIAGMNAEEIAAGLTHISPRGRMECVGCCAGRYIYIDACYEADALANALDVLRTYTEARLSVVVGSVGGRAVWRRAPLGKAATEHADFAYFTADDADFEDPEAICTDMAEDADLWRSRPIPDRRRAILRAVLELRPGDTLLLAGKGAQTHQLIGGIRHPFDERDIVKTALAQF